MKTLEQLKSQAYDALVKIEQGQAELKEANTLIANFKPEDPEKE